MAQTRHRSFATRNADETLESFAARVLPTLATEKALAALRGWNPHIFGRRRDGEVLGSDVVFIEAPLPAAAMALTADATRQS